MYSVVEVLHDHLHFSWPFCIWFRRFNNRQQPTMVTYGVGFSRPFGFVSTTAIGLKSLSYSDSIYNLLGSCMIIYYVRLYIQSLRCNDDSRMWVDLKRIALPLFRKSSQTAEIFTLTTCLASKIGYVTRFCFYRIA